MYICWYSKRRPKKRERAKRGNMCLYLCQYKHDQSCLVDPETETPRRKRGRHDIPESSTVHTPMYMYTCTHVCGPQTCCTLCTCTCTCTWVCGESWLIIKKIFNPPSKFSRLSSWVSYSFLCLFVCLYFTDAVCWVWVSFLSPLPLRLPYLCSVLVFHVFMYMCVYVYSETQLQRGRWRLRSQRSWRSG